MNNIQVNLFPVEFDVDFYFNSRFLHLLDCCLKLSSISLLNEPMQKRTNVFLIAFLSPIPFYTLFLLNFFIFIKIQFKDLKQLLSRNNMPQY